MARRQRNQKTELNFDGLTDAVTNLTGTLILLVVLLFGITTETRPERATGGRPVAEDLEPIGPLLEQVEVLKLQIEMVDRQIHRLEQGLPELQARVQKLKQPQRGDQP